MYNLRKITRSDLFIKYEDLIPEFYSTMHLMEKAMATHSSTLAWKIPWMEEPGRLQSMGSLRVGRSWVTSLYASKILVDTLFQKCTHTKKRKETYFELVLFTFFPSLWLHSTEISHFRYFLFSNSNAVLKITIKHPLALLVNLGTQN